MISAIIQILFVTFLFILTIIWSETLAEIYSRDKDPKFRVEARKIRIVQHVLCAFVGSGLTIAVISILQITGG